METATLDSDASRNDGEFDAAALLSRLAGFFAAAPAGTVWVVGGSVRDAILGRPAHDIDLAVAGDAMPAGRAIADLLGGAFVPIAAHNIARVALPGGAGAGSADDPRPFLIDVAGYYGDIADDLRRRDFTVNAMGIPLDKWDCDERMDHLLDPCGGLGDIARHILRMTGDAVFEDDPGRLLRGVRLAQQLGFRLEPSTARRIRQDAPLLERVAPERVRDEFLLLLASDGARPLLEILDRLGLLCRIIPELEAARNCDQLRAHHYWDVLGHLLHCVEYAEAVTAGHRNNAIYTLAPWTAATDAHFAQYAGDGHTRRTVLKLAALLHDIAKPQTKARHADGRIRFLGHSEQGAEIVQHRLAALRMSGAIRSLTAAMTRHHLRPAQLREQDRMPSRRAIYRYYRDVGPAAVDTLYLSMADYLAARGPELEPERWANYAKMIAVILETGPAPPPAQGAAPSTLVDGNDLMNALHLAPGPTVGRLLESLREAEAAGAVASRDEALALAAQLLANDAAAAP